ncbi:MAG: DNA/pantothenate metabolism flavoprotein [Elusimicrobia bacterium]|nr:DNA/pantothenate metabolism flavoprotein [Elusimicrobiota bacterium]
MKILLTSGGTREPIDAARCVANTSTGRTGAELAVRLAELDCEVHAVCAAHGEIPAGRGVSVTRYSTFKELDAALREALAAEDFDAVVHLAAVSDYSPVLIEAGGRRFKAGVAAKLDSSAPELKITLRRNYKIIGRLKGYALKAGRRPPLVVGFKLTSGASPAEALKKARSVRGADLVVHNDLAEMGLSHPFHVYRCGKKTADVAGTEALAGLLFSFLKEAVTCC